MDGLGQDAVFLKTGAPAQLSMFEAEAEGLDELRRAGAIRVPAVIDVGLRDGQSFIALERLALGRASAATEARFGTALAELHRHTRDAFGWHRDNTIGPTPQRNAETRDWVKFYRTQRIEYQLRLAADNGFTGDLQALGEHLIEQIPDLLAGHEPEASLLHGDLWGGNWGAVDDEPVIFDPAVYYGDRETDIAMTRLFGGFGEAFYCAYGEAWPLAPGYEARLALYQLYHVLNHLNLFGGGYLGQAIRLMRSLSGREFA